MRAGSRWSAGAVAVGTVLLLALLIEGLYLSSNGRTVRADTRPEFSPQPEGARHLIVRCTDEGTDVTTPVVEASATGVAVRIFNQRGAAEFYIRSADDPSMNQGGRLRRRGVTRIQTSSPPGDLLIGCFGGLSDIPYWETDDPAFARATVVDPEDLWNPVDLKCVDKFDSSRIRVKEKTSHPDLERLARRYVRGIRDDDVFERPGYPETGWKLETLTVLRSGQRIARVMTSRGNPPELLVHSCSGSRIG